MQVNTQGLDCSDVDIMDVFDHVLLNFLGLTRVIWMSLMSDSMQVNSLIPLE